MTRRRDRSPGFTLAEVLVAMGILSVGIVGVVGAMSTCARADGRNRRTADAVALAERRLALAAATPTALLTPGAGQEGDYQWTLTLDDGPHGLKCATVRVQWLQQGEARTYRLRRILAPVELRDD